MTTLSTPKPAPGLAEIDARLDALAAREHAPNIEDGLLTALEALRPPDKVSTWEWACDNRKVRGRSDDPIDFNPKLTPYMKGIHDAFDDPSISTMVVVGPARSAKTNAAENYLGKMAKHGPKSDVYWFMQDFGAVEDYTDQEVERFIEFHPEIHEKLGTRPKDRGRERKRIGPMYWRWASATKSNLRGKTAPVLIGDEIDAWKKEINDPLRMMGYRRVSFGRRSKLYLCSHPDRGLNAGIFMYYGQSDQRRWLWPCWHCNGWSTPYPGTRMPTTKLVYDKPDNQSVAECLEHIEQSAHLNCPHCECEIEHKHKFAMNEAGVWLPKGQEMDYDTGKVSGKAPANSMAGWTIHGTMSPFMSWGDLATEKAAALEHFELTQQEGQLREVVVKGLGECYSGPSQNALPMDPESLKERIQAPSQWFGTVPRYYENGQLKVLFLTATVDTHGWGFSIAVIGWGKHGESWLVDRFDMKQTEGFASLQPSRRLEDWSVLRKFLLTQVYPFQEDPERGLKIASMTIDSQGEAGVTPIVRAFQRETLDMGIKPWQMRFLRGGAKTLIDLDKMSKIDKDEDGKPVKPTIFEYTVRVDDFKDIISARMQLENPGPGFMHIPANAPDFVYSELTAERKVDGVYDRRGANETFDHYVYGEWSRTKLRPDRASLKWMETPPVWGMPVPTGAQQTMRQKSENRAKDLAKRYANNFR